jgi:hypothetical protein
MKNHPLRKKALAKRKTGTLVEIKFTSPYKSIVKYLLIQYKIKLQKRKGYLSRLKTLQYLSLKISIFHKTP